VSVGAGVPSIVFGLSTLSSKTLGTGFSSSGG